MAFLEYPKALYRPDGTVKVVYDATSEAALGEGWYQTPTLAGQALLTQIATASISSVWTDGGTAGDDDGVLTVAVGPMDVEAAPVPYHTRNRKRGRK